MFMGLEMMLFDEYLTYGLLSVQPLPADLHDQEQLGNFLPYSAWSTNLSNPDHTRDNSFTRFNEWLPLPSLEEMVQNEIERDLALPAANEHPLHNMRYGLEDRSSGRDGERRNHGEGSGSEGQISNIGGSGSEGREGND